jgi:hypothetical protein
MTEDLYTEITKSETMTNTFDRESLIADYVDRLLDNMSTKDLMRMVGDMLEENLASYSDDELKEEINEYYPELLEG